MDKIDLEINDLYKSNSRVPPKKFLIIMFSVVGFNFILVSISFFYFGLFLRMVMELVAGVIMTSFFIWFYLKVLKKQ